MKSLKDKVVVITGAASGIGLAIAGRCLQENMKVVLADVEKNALFQAEEELKGPGKKVLAVLTDVSKEEDMKVLAQKTLNTFGAVHLLFNNAGVVGTVTSIWKSSLLDWEWVMGVNLYGIVNGIRTFVPIMLEQETECHIVNTSSMGALIYGPGGLYSVSKHAVVGLSETLYRELMQRRSRIKVSLFCPGFVKTRIMDSDRNCPFKREEDQSEKERNGGDRRREQARRQTVDAGLTPKQAADILFKGIQEERFYILSDRDVKPLIRERMETIIAEGTPKISFS